MFNLWGSSQQDQKTKEAYAESKINELKVAIGPLSGHSLKYCTDACLRRYLEARNWNVDKSKKMLEDTLKWRSVYKPEKIRWDEVAEEGETGKVYRAGFHDRQGRTVLILRPGMQHSLACFGELMEIAYDMFISCFQLISISSPK
ncbi:random slug protein 5-like [Trifolium medium]|uniref:Random slug protein 5-like n=1 Tax=Trifolium medium TaxID=97028 RepID=A0A392MV42_9FABA|nr:random slug protein 5-like [Trifolium medium]